MKKTLAMLCLNEMTRRVKHNVECSISLRILKHRLINLHEMKIVAQIFNNLLTRNGCYTLLWAGV